MHSWVPVRSRAMIVGLLGRGKAKEADFCGAVARLVERGHCFAPAKALLTVGPLLEWHSRI